MFESNASSGNVRHVIEKSFKNSRHDNVFAASKQIERRDR